MRLKTNKQERRQVKPNGAEGRAAVYRMSQATNDEFNGLVNGRARLGVLHCDAGARTRAVTLLGEARAAGVAVAYDP